MVIEGEVFTQPSTCLMYVFIALAPGTSLLQLLGHVYQVQSLHDSEGMGARRGASIAPNTVPSQLWGHGHGSGTAFLWSQERIRWVQRLHNHKGMGAGHGASMVPRA